jgi:hypothetical protein
MRKFPIHPVVIKILRIAYIFFGALFFIAGIYSSLDSKHFKWPTIWVISQSLNVFILFIFIILSIPHKKEYDH